MLSKSQYIRGLQCQKSLWLSKKNPELRDKPDEQTESRFQTGHDVGEIAKELFPGGTEIEFDSSDFDGMIQKTRDLIDSEVDVIYEASFKERGVFAMADLLVKNDDAWDIYEVKSSTQVKDYHRNDAAVQWYALSNVLTLNKAFIVHIDNRYVRNGELEIKKLLKISDVTDEVLERQSSIESNLKGMESALSGNVPDINIGTHCESPFTCDFKEYCWKDVPSPSVFNLYSMNLGKKFDMYHSGLQLFEDIPDDFKLSKTQQIQVITSHSKTPFIDKAVIREFIGSVEYPINFFDFETFQNAIPRFDGQSPYKQLPFQYSLHILHQDGNSEHKEYLGDEDSDPRVELIEHMLEDITTSGTIMAYNHGFEKGVIKELAKYHPEKAEALLSLNERFVDLLVPFRKLGYYHPNFKGSFSIKSVLPAMFPNDSELDYKQLAIQDGGMAMDIFANLHLIKDKNKRNEIRKNLLSYCHLDTLAMVEIWKKLQKIVGKEETNH